MRRPFQCSLFFALTLAVVFTPQTLLAADHIDSFHSVGYCKFFSEPVDATFLNVGSKDLLSDDGRFQFSLKPASHHRSVSIETAPNDNITFVYQRRSSRVWNFAYRQQASNVSLPVIKRASIPTILIRNQGNVSFRLAAAKKRISPPEHWRNSMESALHWAPVLRYAQTTFAHLHAINVWAAAKAQSVSEGLYSRILEVFQFRMLEFWLVERF